MKSFSAVPPHNLCRNRRYSTWSSFNDCAFGLAYYHFKCPFILCPAVIPSYFDDFGLQVESSSIPDMVLGNGLPLSFWDRLGDTWQPIRWMLKRRLQIFLVLNKMFQEKLQLNFTPNFAEVYISSSSTHITATIIQGLCPHFLCRLVKLGFSTQ